MNLPGIHSLAHIKKTWINRSQPEYMRVFARLYWHSLLSVAVIITVGAALYSVTLFFDVLSQLKSAALLSTTKPTAEIPATVNLNSSLLESTISTFAARQGQFQALQQTPVPPANDPSQ
jgi:hypothetical protein